MNKVGVEIDLGDQNQNEPIDKILEVKPIEHNQDSESNPLPSQVIFGNENKSKSHNDEIKDMFKHLRNESIKIVLKSLQIKHGWLKFYLILILILLLGITSYMLVYLFLGYFAFEVNTKTTTYTEAESVFPKITLCNNNMFQTEYALNLLKQIDKNVNKGNNFFDDSNAKNLSGKISSAFNLYYDAKAYVTKNYFTETQRKHLGHDPNALIQHCRFGTSSCTANDFFWYFDGIFGNCYVFNSGFNSSGDRIELKKTGLPGKLGALSLYFYVGFHENLTSFNSFTVDGGLGAIIRIENNSYLVDNSLQNFDIQVWGGSNPTIGIHRSFEFSLPKPYSNCDIPNDIDSSQQEEFIRTYSLYGLFAQSQYQYTREACFVQCYQQRIIQKCNCTDTTLLSLFTNVSSCETEDQINCNDKYFYFNQSWSWDPCLNACPLECNKTKYSLQISSLQLFGDSYALTIESNPDLASDFMTFPIPNDVASRSFVSLKIYYDSLSYETREEQPKMNIIDLIAAIGGNLSLFLGVSVFTFLEIVEIFLEIWYIRRKRVDQKPKNN